MKPWVRVSVPRRGITAVASVASALLVTACAQQAIFLPSHDFERPTDMAFSCLRVMPGADPADTKVVGLPMDACHPSGAPDPAIGITDATKVSNKTFAFVTNSERGDISVVDMSFCRSNDSACQQKSLQPGAAIVDLDPSTIGYAAAPVGEFPESVVASQDGCRLLIANQGSCDLTLIDPAKLLTPHLIGGKLETYSKTFMVRTASGVPLAVSPGEIQFVPQQTVGLSRDDGNICTADGHTLAAPVGEPAASLDSPASWRAVVTFPSCDMVALVDLVSERILDSYQVKQGPDGGFLFTQTGAEPVCLRTDCGLGAGTFVDAGAPAATADGLDTGGSPSTDSLAVRPLAIRPDGKRVYFGATNASAVGALDIVGATLGAPETAESTLLPGSRGVMRLRLSIDPFAYASGQMPALDEGAAPPDPTKPEFGRFVSLKEQDPANPLEYLYVIARDASLRIMDVSQRTPVECDVGIDPTQLTPAQEAKRKCFPVDESKSLAHLPQVLQYDGLRFPTAPQDVAFASYWTDLSADPTVETVNEQTLNGAFAFVLTGGGAVFLINVDPAIRQTAQVVPDPEDPTKLKAQLQDESPRPLPNTPRDANVITYTTNLLPASGPARVDSAVPVTTSNGPILRVFEATTTRENAVIVPFLQNSIWTPPTMSVPSYVYFPNPVTVLPQTWTIAWEPDLTGVRVNGDIDPTRTPADDALGLTMAITDQGAAFCQSGIFPGDTLTLVGCTSDDNCGPGRVCVRNPDAPSTSGGLSITGLCFRGDDAAGKTDAILTRCGRLLASFRRYEILPTTTPIVDKAQPESTVIVVPKKAELPVTGLCKESLNCPPASRTDLGSTGMNFTCDVPSNRCLIKCAADDKTPCELKRPGSTCVDFGAAAGGSFCADGAPLRDLGGPPDDLAQSCGLGQLISYSVSAGRSYVVAGGAVGRIDPGQVVDVSADAKGGLWQCAPAEAHDSPLVSRIPLDLPRCQTPKLANFMPGPLDFAGKPTALVPKEADYKAAFVDSALPSPNPCFIEYGEDTAAGGSDGAVTEKSAPTYSALFQNREVRFVLTNLEKTVGDTVRIQFGVNGGAVAQQVNVAVDSAVGLPARLLLGPVSSADQTLPLMAPPGGPASDLPYLYVIDQRPSAVGRSSSRGQILRIAPRVDATNPLPAYQSGTTSNSYFPIQ